MVGGGVSVWCELVCVLALVINKKHQRTTAQTLKGNKKRYCMSKSWWVSWVQAIQMWGLHHYDILTPRWSTTHKLLYMHKGWERVCKCVCVWEKEGRCGFIIIPQTAEAPAASTLYENQIPTHLKRYGQPEPFPCCPQDKPWVPLHTLPKIISVISAVCTWAMVGGNCSQHIS